LEAVEENTLSVEPVGFQPLPVVKASAMECGGPKYVATLVGPSSTSGGWLATGYSRGGQTTARGPHTARCVV